MQVDLSPDEQSSLIFHFLRISQDCNYFNEQSVQSVQAVDRMILVQPT